MVQELAKEKLVILISHRLANVVKADSIYVVKAGEIVETGNHAALLAQGRDYSRLFKAQQELEKYAGGMSSACMSGPTYSCEK